MSKKTLFSIILLGTFGFLCIWAFSTSKSILGETSLSQKNTPAGERINLKELIILETKEGQKFWEVYADSGYYEKAGDIAILKNISGNFFKDGKIVFSVASPEATYNNDRKEVTLKGGASAANDRNVYIEADEICWAGTKDKITARGNVKIMRNDEFLTVSEESSFDTDFTNLELSGNSKTYVFSLGKF